MTMSPIPGPFQFQASFPSTDPCLEGVGEVNTKGPMSGLVSADWEKEKLGKPLWCVCVGLSSFTKEFTVYETPR